MCALHSEGEIIANFPPSAFSSKAVRARWLPGLAWEVQPKVNGLPRSLLLLRPLGLRASLRHLHARSLSEESVAVQGTAPLAQCKSSYFLFCCWLRRKLPVDVVAKSLLQCAACCSRFDLSCCQRDCPQLCMSQLECSHPANFWLTRSHRVLPQCSLLLRILQSLLTALGTPFVRV